MAFRKNKKFIDPRYFMDEKTDKKVIKEALPKYTQLPEDPDLLQYGDEQRMDEVSKELENQFVQHALVTLNVPDFDGAMDDLDAHQTGRVVGRRPLRPHRAGWDHGIEERQGDGGAGATQERPARNALARYEFHCLSPVPSRESIIVAQMGRPPYPLQHSSETPDC